MNAGNDSVYSIYHTSSNEDHVNDTVGFNVISTNLSKTVKLVKSLERNHEGFDLTDECLVAILANVEYAGDILEFYTEVTDTCK